MRHLVLLTCALSSLSGASSAQEVEAPPVPWTQLSRSTCNVDAFLAAHPERDGRGVVIAVLDTGIDPAVAGLRALPDGSPKVVDVQDFSGQGDVALSVIRRGPDGALLHYAEDGAPEAYVAPDTPDGATLWFGEVDEDELANSDVEDVNDNGSKSDLFGVLVVVPRGGGDDDALVYVDTNADRSFADEAPLRNYRLAQETFDWARAKKERQIVPMTSAINVFLRERKLVIHYDDGGHGTHVAGIAAGYRLLGQADFHGIAPGARVISLKIGDGRLSGGATTTGSMKAAFDYAARYAREHGVQVVCNLSYGIDSEREGLAAVDRYVDELCLQNPELIVCTSAGNSGPGLSTIGTPAAASHAITIAALLAQDTARDVQGAELPHAYLAVFSSRGGELCKPDVATPGYATSSVPRWTRWDDHWSGTSMASPYAAGLCALLVSGREAPVRSSWVKSALMRSASPLPGYTPLDYGAGVPDVVQASRTLDGITERAAKSPLFALAVTTDSPHAPDGEGTGAYWRTTWSPGERPLRFTIEPRFAPGRDAAARTAFSRRYTLSSDVSWLKPRQQQFYLRGEQEATVAVDVVAAQLTEPGLYVGRVEAQGPDDVDLRLVASIVVPHRFHAGNGYSVELTRQQVAGWVGRRHFVAVPTGASAMHVALRAPDGARSTARIREVFRPDGSNEYTRELRLDTLKNQRAADWSLSRGLSPGIWELYVASDEPGETSVYDLSVRFSGVRAAPDSIESWHTHGGQRPLGDFVLTNQFERPVTVVGEGAIVGSRETRSATLTPGEDTFEVPLAFEQGVRAVRVRVEFSKVDFAQFTDVALGVYAGEGKALARDAMGGRTLELTANSPGPGTSATLELVGAFTDPHADVQAEAKVQVDFLYESPIPVAIRQGEASEVTLYPGVPVELSFTLGSAPPELADERTHVGTLTLRDTGSGEVVLEVPIER